MNERNEQTGMREFPAKNPPSQTGTILTVGLIAVGIYFLVRPKPEPPPKQAS